MEAIQQWLSPIRALAVANMRSSKNGHEGHAHPEGEEEAKSFRHLVEQNVCAQVSNVASSSVIKNAWKAGKKITVHGKRGRGGGPSGPETSLLKLEQTPIFVHPSCR